MAPSKQRSLSIQSSLTLALKPYLMREIKDRRGFVRNKNKCLLHALHDYIVYLEKLLVDCNPQYVTNNRNACQLVTNFESEQEQLQEELKDEMNEINETANNTVETSVNTTETASETTMITDEIGNNSDAVLPSTSTTTTTATTSTPQLPIRRRYFLRRDYLSYKTDMDAIIASLDHNNNNTQKQQKRTRTTRKRKTTEEDEPQEQQTIEIPQSSQLQSQLQPQPPTTLLTIVPTIQQQSTMVSPQSIKVTTPVTTPKNEPVDDEVIIVDDIQMNTPESMSTLLPPSHSSNHSTPISVDSKPELTSELVKLPVSPVSMISTSNIKGNFTRDEITLDLVNEVITNQSSPLSPQDSNSSNNSTTNTEQVGGCNRVYQELIAIYNKC